MDIVERLNNSDAPYYESSLRINRKLERDIEEAAAEIERLREALHKLIQACDAGKLREVGIGGMTLDAQLRRSVLNGVSAWAVEEARAALGEEK